MSSQSTRAPSGTKTNWKARISQWLGGRDGDPRARQTTDQPLTLPCAILPDMVVGPSSADAASSVDLAKRKQYAVVVDDHKGIHDANMMAEDPLGPTTHIAGDTSDSPYYSERISQADYSSIGLAAKQRSPVFPSNAPHLLRDESEEIVTDDLFTTSSEGDDSMSEAWVSEYVESSSQADELSDAPESPPASEMSEHIKSEESDDFEEEIPSTRAGKKRKRPSVESLRASRDADRKKFKPSRDLKAAPTPKTVKSRRSKGKPQIRRKRQGRYMDADQRKKDLEGDWATLEVTPNTVKCGGCTQTIRLDTRPRKGLINKQRVGEYYGWNWWKHRATCQKLEKKEKELQSARFQPQEYEAAQILVSMGSPEGSKNSERSTYEG